MFKYLSNMKSSMVLQFAWVGRVTNFFQKNKSSKGSEMGQIPILGTTSKNIQKHPQPVAILESHSLSSSGRHPSPGRKHDLKRKKSWKIPHPMIILLMEGIRLYNQFRLVVYPIFHRVLAPSQVVVWDF